MDATNTVTISIAGREIEATRPTSDQLVGLTLFESPHMPEGAKLKALTTMFLKMLPTDDDRSWLMEQMCDGAYTLEEMATSIKAIATSPDKPVKKTAARKRTA